MQEHFWSGTSWFLILSLVFGSAVLAFLGDILGFHYGKQRISLFGLRPKYTSRLITAIMGGITTVIVLAVLSVFSQDVRTALFSMKYIQQQLYTLRQQLNESQMVALQAQTDLINQQERMQITITSLDFARIELETLRNDRLILEQERKDLEGSLMVMREESETLKRALKDMKSGAIALTSNVLLAQGAFDPEIISGDKDNAYSWLDRLEQQVRFNIRGRLSETALIQRGIVVEFNPDDETEILNQLSSAEQRYYVRALSSENVAFGENIPVRLEMGDSLLIYPDETIVYRKMYDASAENFDAEQALHNFLRELKTRAIHDGVLPEPSTNNVGTLSGEEFFNTIEKLQDIHTPVIINAIASGDIYTEGPVVITITFDE